MAKVVKTKSGKDFTLLNPSEKGEKFAKELRAGHKYTNSGDFKNDEDGVLLKLSKEQRAYRAGYLDHSSDSSKAYCKKNGIESKAKKRIFTKKDK